MISTISKTTQLLKKHHIFPKKKYGQNFLINLKITEKIVSIVDIDKETVVFEIGPGLGALTELLVKKAHSVIGYEIDEKLVKILETEFKEQENLQIINADFLKVSPEELSKLANGRKIVIVSNLPYYATSEIITKIILLPLKIKEVIVMLQKEVGERIVSKENGKNINELVLFSHYFADVEYMFTVASDDFYPRPKVDSAVLAFRLKETRFNEEKFISVLKGIFVQRRKTLYNNLLALKLDPNKITVGLENLKLKPTTRSENLSLTEIKTVCDYFKDLL